MLFTQYMWTMHVYVGKAWAWTTLLHCFRISFLIFRGRTLRAKSQLKWRYHFLLTKYLLFHVFYDAIICLENRSSVSLSNSPRHLTMSPNKHTT